MDATTTWYPFDEHPQSDSTWALSTGPDGRIYAASCCETVPGNTAKLVRYDDQADCIEYLIDIDEAVDDPRDSGRGTQCKIHYSFAPSYRDGVLYMATHLSGAPPDLPAYSPWRFWHEPDRCFRGAALLAWDTSADKVLWWQTMLPKEGCRCLLLDEDRGLLYAISYPRDHLLAFDLERRTLRDLGRIGSVNAQALFLDARHRVWTSDDDGRLVRYDPDVGRLERSPYLLPHDPRYQTGWHSVLYDVTPAPDGRTFYGVTWIARPMLFRFRPDQGQWGTVESLGPATQDHDPRVAINTFVDHCGGLTFGPDGRLYYVSTSWTKEAETRIHRDAAHLTGTVYAMDVATGQSEPVVELHRPDGWSHYATRGAVDRRGDLFFGAIAHRIGPTGLHRVRLEGMVQGGGIEIPRRSWG
jgi:hypothetical protein